MAYEQYRVKREQIDEEYARREISRQITIAEATIEVLKSLGIDTAENEKNLNKLKRSLYNQDVENSANAEKRKAKDREAKLDEYVKRLQQTQKITSNLFGAVGEFLSIGVDRKKVAVEELEATQQKNYENEVKRITKSQDTEENKANRLKILEAQRQAQKEANERMQRQLEVERARFQRAADVANIVTSTAVAVVNALGAKPWSPLNIALAFSVGALGAAQVAKALSVPLPKYQIGTSSSNQGWALTDEAGPELYKEPDGKMYVGNNGPTLRYLKRGTKITPANEVHKELHKIILRQQAGAIEHKEPAKKDETAQAIQMQTEMLLRQLKKQKPSTVKNIIDLGWFRYVADKTFN